MLIKHKFERDKEFFKFLYVFLYRFEGEKLYDTRYTKLNLVKARMLQNGLVKILIEIILLSYITFIYTLLVRYGYIVIFVVHCASCFMPCIFFMSTFFS